MTPEKFFQNLSLAEYLTFFETRFDKIGWRGDKIESQCPLVLTAVFHLLKIVTMSVFCHSSKSSICASLIRHSLAFSGLSHLLNHNRIANFGKVQIFDWLNNY